MPPRRCRNAGRLPLTSQATCTDRGVTVSAGCWMLARPQSGTGDQKSPRSAIEAHSLGIEEAGRHQLASEAPPEVIERDAAARALEAAFDQPHRDRMTEMGAPIAAGDVADAARAPAGGFDRAGSGRDRLRAIREDADQPLA